MGRDTSWCWRFRFRLAADALIEVVYEDTELLAVNKPAGLLVHRSAIAADEKVFLLDQVRQQVGAPVFLAHRLDRATSGVLLLAKSREIAGELGKQLMARAVEKSYLAVVRGWPEAEGTIDYPLPDSRERSPRKPALTRWRTLATVELLIALGKYPQQRYATPLSKPYPRPGVIGKSASICIMFRIT